MTHSGDLSVQLSPEAMVQRGTSTRVGSLPVILAAGFIFGGAFVGPAMAAEPSAPKPKTARKTPAAEPAYDRVAAKQAYEEALRAFNLGHWQDAVAGFEKSYTLSGDPALLFNVAQAQRQAGNVKEAVIAYKAFLREKPDTPHREMIEAKLKELESGAVAKTTSAKPGESKSQADGLSGIFEDPFDWSKPSPAEAAAVAPVVVGQAPVRPVLPAPSEPSPVQVSPKAPSSVAGSIPPQVAQEPMPMRVSALDLRQQPAAQDTSAGTSSRWWLWTGIGAVVAAGVVTAVILSTRGAERDTSCPSGVNGCLPVGN